MRHFTSFLSFATFFIAFTGCSASSKSQDTQEGGTQSIVAPGTTRCWSTSAVKKILRYGPGSTTTTTEASPYSFTLQRFDQRIFLDINDVSSGRRAGSIDLTIQHDDIINAHVASSNNRGKITEVSIFFGFTGDRKFEVIYDLHHDNKMRAYIVATGDCRQESL